MSVKVGHEINSDHDSAPAVRRLAGAHSHIRRHWYLQPPPLPSVSSRNAPDHAGDVSPALLQPEHVRREP